MTTPSPPPSWWLPACRRRFGLSQVRPPDEPKPAPAWCLAEWERYVLWMAWIDNGKKPPRPPTFWAKVPDWAWTLNGEYRKAHPKPHPPPPPGQVAEKHSRWTLDQVGGFGFRLSWGLANSQWTVQEVVDLVCRMKEPHTGKPVRALSLERHPEEAKNDPFHLPLKAACHAATTWAGTKLQYRLWERCDQGNTWEGIQDSMDRFQPDVYEADIEDFPMDATLPIKFAAKYPDQPRMTLNAGFPGPELTESQIHPWYLPVADGGGDFACGTQAYSHSAWQGGVPPVPGRAGQMDRDAYWRGVPLCAIGGGLHSYPMIGLNQEGDGDLASQLGAVEMFAPHYGIEWLESCNGADLKLLGV
jgi:hypothetical protein